MIKYSNADRLDFGVIAKLNQLLHMYSILLKRKITYDLFNYFKNLYDY